MTYFESIQKIKKAIYGHYDEIAAKVGCSRPVVSNALSKQSVSELSPTERKVINEAVKLAAHLESKTSEFEKSIVDVASTIK